MNRLIPGFTQVVALNAEREKMIPPEIKYVYATKNEAFPGLIKIGKAKNVKTRLQNLNTGCAPSPHVLIAKSPSLNYSRDEKAAHAFFANKRKDGEFFEVSEEKVIKFFQSIQFKFQRDLEEWEPEIPRRLLNKFDANEAADNAVRTGKRKRSAGEPIKVESMPEPPIIPVAEEFVPPVAQEMPASDRLLIQDVDRYNAMCTRQFEMIDTYKTVCLNNSIDDHAKQVFKEMLLRTAGRHPLINI